MADDACNVVKADIQAGTFTRYTTAFPIYIKDEDKFQGGNVYIQLKDSKRIPTMSVVGSVSSIAKSCTLTIHSTSTEIRDNILDDLFDIFQASSTNYDLESMMSDNPASTNVFEIEFPIKITC